MSEGIRVLIERSIVSEGEELPTLGIGKQDYALKVNGFSQDTSYGSVKLGYLGDRVRKIKESATLDIQHRKKTSYLVRGQVEDNVALDNLIEAVEKDKNSIAVFTDPVITTFCDSDNPPIGNHHEVRKLLGYLRLRQEKLDGTGVYVCIVDTGLNLDLTYNQVMYQLPKIIMEQYAPLMCALPPLGVP
jgi:hypothetical protein